MRRKAVLMLLVGAVALCLAGCRDDDQAADTRTGGTTDTQTSRDTAQDQGTIQPVPEGQGGTATTGQPGGTATTRQPGAATDDLAQQRNQYVQGAEQILTSMEQKLNTWQQQAGTQQDPAQQQKMQDLSKQVQTELADARAAVDKMRNASGTQLKDAKVAADQALQDAEAAFKNLQSFVNQTQVTQVD